MFFRVIINDQSSYRCFSNIIQTLAKNGKDCALNIRQDEMIFIVREDNKRALPLIWCEMKTDAFFASSTFRGVDAENNEIVLLFNPTFMAKALGSIKQVFEEVKIKLIKAKQNSYLSIDVTIISIISSEKKHIVHDIPVKVLLPSKWDTYLLPELPTFNTIIELPNIKYIVDKYKNLSPTMTFFVNVANRELSLAVETDMTTVISNFFNLNIDHKADAGEENSSPEVSCRVETKPLALFINSLQLPPLQKCLFIRNENVMKLRFVIREHVTLYGMVTAVYE